MGFGVQSHVGSTRHHSRAPPQRALGCGVLFVYFSGWRARAGKRGFGTVQPRVVFSWKLFMLAKPSGIPGG